MKLSRYYPFERNRYFYGKLLTVRDFDSEQKYFNNKRRLMNRLLHGTGVVSGLQVVAIDDKSISVEMGLALDHFGREIVVSSPVTLKLSTVDGFTNNEYAKNIYLCISYDEKGKEPVHSVANSSRTDEVSEYNRIMESYKLFIQEEPPAPSSFELNALFENTCVIYQDDQVRVLQKTPPYINPEDEFDVVLTIEKTIQTPKLSFEFEIESDHFQLVDKVNRSKISFTEPHDGQETVYNLTYTLKASKEATSENSFKVCIKPDSAQLIKGDQEMAVETNAFNTVEVIEGLVKNRILKDYFSRTLEQSVSSSADPCIYLAKISLLQMGSTYIIEKVDQIPFNEYIHSSSFLHRLEQIDTKRQSVSSPQQQGISIKSEVLELSEDEKPEFRVSYEDQLNEFQFKLGLPKTSGGQEEVSTGIVEIKLAHRGVFSKAKGFYSEEIKHGLGKNETVLIMTGIEETANHLARSAKQIFFGNSDVFKDSEYETDMSNISIGSILYPNKGTFRIGVKHQGSVQAPTLKIRWWAIRKTIVDIVDKEIDQYSQQEIAASNEDDGKE